MIGLSMTQTKLRPCDNNPTDSIIGLWHEGCKIRFIKSHLYLRVETFLVGTLAPRIASLLVKPRPRVPTTPVLSYLGLLTTTVGIK